MALGRGVPMVRLKGVPPCPALPVWPVRAVVAAEVEAKAGGATA